MTANTSEANNETTMVSAKARKKVPATPSRKARGMNTTTGVRVEASRGRRISPKAWVTASKRGVPSEILAYTASTTTMASSMIKPIAAAMPPSVIRLKPKPSTRKASKVISTVVGITTAAVSVAPQFLRKT